MLLPRPLLLPCAKYPPRRRWIWLRICICIIYVTRGRGAKSARRCAVDHCVSSVSIFIYLFALLRARPPNYHDAAPPPALIRRRPELFIYLYSTSRRHTAGGANVSAGRRRTAARRAGAARRAVAASSLDDDEVRRILRRGGRDRRGARLTNGPGGRRRALVDPLLAQDVLVGREAPPDEHGVKQGELADQDDERDEQRGVRADERQDRVDATLAADGVPARAGGDGRAPAVGHHQLDDHVDGERELHRREDARRRDHREEVAVVLGTDAPDRPGVVWAPPPSPRRAPGTNIRRRPGRADARVFSHLQ